MRTPFFLEPQPFAEMELLLCCGRTRLGPKLEERVRTLLQQKLDWDFLLRIAGRHGLSSLIYRNLIDHFSEAVPEKTLKSLQAHYQQNSRKNLLLTCELVRILETFRAEEIPAMPFKGPALTEALYGNLAFREFCDLDILVPRERVQEAVDRLVKAGYRSYVEFSPDQFQLCLDFFHHFLLSHSNKGISVEIHWEFFRGKYNFPLDMSRFWANRKSLPENDHGLGTLPPEEMLLVLCAHGTVHTWEELKWVCDVAELVRGPVSLDWKRVLKLSRDLRCRRVLFLGLFLARELFGAPPPEELSAQIEADPTVLTLAGQIWRNLNAEPARSVSKFESFVFNLKAKDRLSDRIRLCWGFAFAMTEADMRSLQLPENLFFLHYILRPLRLGKELGLRLFRRLFHVTKAQG